MPKRATFDVPMFCVSSGWELEAICTELTQGLTTSARCFVFVRRMRDLRWCHRFWPFTGEGLDRKAVGDIPQPCSCQRRSWAQNRRSRTVPPGSSNSAVMLSWANPVQGSSAQSSGGFVSLWTASRPNGHEHSMICVFCVLSSAWVC